MCRFLNIFTGTYSSLNEILRYKYVISVLSGVQRSGDARGDCLIGCPPYQNVVLISGPWWSLLLDMRYL